MTGRPPGAAAAPPGTYWVEPGRLLAGPYPGHVDPSYAAARLRLLAGLGVDWFLDLTSPGELPDYAALFDGPGVVRTARPIQYSRHPLRDHEVPATRAPVAAILDELDAALASGRVAYVHCRAGIGRTGLVIGCYLARRLGDGDAALVALEQLWIGAGRRHAWPGTPETAEQAAFVRDWREPARARGDTEALPAVAAADRLRDRYRGLLLGLALGDALAAPVQHRRPGTFTPVGDLLGGGPYDLPRGGWTDDTAVALVLADGLLDSAAFDAADFLARLRRWQQDGYRSATGQCLGITAAMARALAQAPAAGPPRRAAPDTPRIEAEPLVRAGVAVAWSLEDPARAIELAAETIRATHPSEIGEDAGRCYAALVVGALQGVPKAELVAPGFSPVPGLWRAKPLQPAVAELMEGGWRSTAAAAGGQGVATGGALEALGLLFAALAGGHGYRDTVLAAVNRGLDADVHGALVGQLAGAVYGAAALPPHWIAALADAAGIADTADRLLAAPLGRIAAM